MSQLKENKTSILHLLDNHHSNVFSCNALLLIDTLLNAIVLTGKVLFLQI